MAGQGYWTRSRNTPLSVKTCDATFLPRSPLYQDTIRKRKGIIGGTQYILPCTRFLFLVRVSSSLFCLQQRPTSANFSSAALSFSSSRLVLSALYHFQSGLLDARSLIWVTQWSMRWSHSSGPVPFLWIMRMHWAISQTRSLTISSIHCIVKPPLSCQIPIVSAARWVTPTPAVSAQTWTWRVGIWIVLASAMPDFGNLQASHWILVSQLWSMIEWWMSSACYSQQASGVLNILSRVMRCGSWGEEGLSKVLEIVIKVGMQGDYIYGLGGFSWSGDIIFAANLLGNN